MNARRLLMVVPIVAVVIALAVLGGRSYQFQSECQLIDQRISQLQYQKSVELNQNLNRQHFVTLGASQRDSIEKNYEYAMRSAQPGRQAAVKAQADAAKEGWNRQLASFHSEPSPGTDRFDRLIERYEARRQVLRKAAWQPWLHVPPAPRFEGD
jgi:hypothetical protein